MPAAAATTGRRRRLRLRELAVDQLALDLQSDEQEEHRHQPVVDPQMHRHRPDRQGEHQAGLDMEQMEIIGGKGELAASIASA